MLFLSPEIPQIIGEFIENYSFNAVFIRYFIQAIIITHILVMKCFKMLIKNYIFAARLKLK